MSFVILPPVLHKNFQGKSKVKVQSQNLIDALRELDAQAPGFFQQIVTPNHRLRPFVRLYLDSTPVKSENLAEIKLDSKSSLRILLGLAGG